MLLETYEPTTASYLRPFFTSPRLSYMWSIHCGADHPPCFRLHCYSRRQLTKTDVVIILPWFCISFTSSGLVMCIFIPLGVSLANCRRRPRHRDTLLRCNVLVRRFRFLINKERIHDWSFNVVRNFFNGKVAYTVYIHARVKTFL